MLKSVPIRLNKRQDYKEFISFRGFRFHCAMATVVTCVFALKRKREQKFELHCLTKRV